MLRVSSTCAAGARAGVVGQAPGQRQGGGAGLAHTGMQKGRAAVALRAAPHQEGLSGQSGGGAHHDSGAAHSNAQQARACTSTRAARQDAPPMPAETQAAQGH